MSKLLNLEEAAKKLNVEEAVVQLWIKGGQLPVIFPSPVGYQIREEDCDRLAASLVKTTIKIGGDHAPTSSPDA